MSSQLDILALEPFYGGARKSMLETVIRCSRHRWTLLKLPPRRIERRLSAAAHWFAEQLSRNWPGRLDLLFTSEAMNLADLFNFTPKLAKKPSVVYFHNNQLPDPGSSNGAQSHDLVNLGTATAATELWFNSTYHLRLFERRAAALVEKYSELSSRNPMAQIMRKSRLMPPPLDTLLPEHIQQGANPIARQPRTIFVETRDADMRLLNAGLNTLLRRGEKFQLMTMGPVTGLSAEFPRTAVSEVDDVAQVQAMLASATFLSARRGVTCDYHAVRAIASGCQPVLPADGVYLELIPKKLQTRYLHDLTPDGIASRVQDAWLLDPPEGGVEAIARSVRPFDAINACKSMDERLEELVIADTSVKA